jgi:hypothetical protein
MAVDREAVYAALAARLQAKVRHLLAGDVRRRIPGFSSLTDADQPCLCVIADTSTCALDGPLPAVWTLRALVILYARSGASPSSSAEPTLNAIVRAIEEALERQPDETSIAPGQRDQHWTTLGGTVIWARPGGSVEYDAGHIEEQAIAAFSVELLPIPD